MSTASTVQLTLLYLMGDLSVMMVVLKEMSIGCSVCSQQDYQMQKVLDYSFIDLYVKTCSPNILSTACEFTEFYDTTVKRCVSCLDRYPQCSACNEQKCLLPLYQYYNSISLYNYTSRAYDVNMLTFYLCGQGQGSSSVGNRCQKSVYPSCLQTYFYYDNSEFCAVCNPGTMSAPPICVPKPTTTPNFTYFIKSGAQYNTTENVSYYFTNSGVSPDTPFYFIGQAIQTAFNSSKKNYLVNATVYLGKGDHFFFYCNNYSGSIFNAQGVVQYCKTYYWYLYQNTMAYDNINFYFKPLYCSLATELGYAANANFLSMCIDQATMPNPTIYVNQAYAYFQIYAFARFENLRFSGINQLIKPVIPSNDMTLLPIKYCNLLKEPEIGAQALDLEQKINPNFNVNYKCININYTMSFVPQTANSTYHCERNLGQQFYSKQESTLASSGEPSYHYYFDISSSTIAMRVVPRRTNTLFNLQAAPEHIAVHMTPPELQIVNCTFEYFLQNYESLVNIQTKDFQFFTLQKLREENVYAYSFITSVSAERGAKIVIANSDFKHSTFSKGLIVYRKQPYVDADKHAFGNFSYYLMKDYPYVQDAGSYIILRNSTFTNLNSGLMNISALAIYGGKDVMRELNINGTKIQYQAMMHKGTVLNIQDFGGFIKITNCTFKSNMHFIPSILNSNNPVGSSRKMSKFLDSSQTLELKMQICNPETKKDEYFFSHGLNQDDDIDALYDSFERLSLIYISRNRDIVIIEKNVFDSNIGTFGGAISINSQDWQQGKQAYIMIHNNTFTKNMAYLSGNAIYIRNSMRADNPDQVCGGISIVNNSFTNNIGLKFHNGGAISLSCYYVKSNTQDDYKATSGYYVDQTDSQYLQKMTSITDPSTSQTITIMANVVNIENCTFDSNFAGSRGTAIYLKQISHSRIENCTFQQNGPVMSLFEKTFSPYTQYLGMTTKTNTYYSQSPQCKDEFLYLSNCYEQGSNVDWSHVQGAVYVEHCQSVDCLINGYKMNFKVQNSKFKNNQIGYIMDENFPKNLSSQLFIKGGFINTIENCTFDNSNGSYTQLITSQLKNFFSEDYFNSQHSSLIRITYEPELDSSLIYQTNILNCSFQNNKHTQSYGLGPQTNYYGSIIAGHSSQSIKQSKYIPIINITNSKFMDNIFTGSDTSLIYIQNVITRIASSVFINNGLVTQESSEQSRYKDPNLYFTQNHQSNFMAFYQNMFQEYGILYIEGIQKFPDTYFHLIMNSTFKYSFSKQSSVFQINIGNQFMSFQNNIYENNFAEIGGIINSYGNIYSNLQDTNDMIIKENSNATILFLNEHFKNQISRRGTIAFTLADSFLKLNLIIINSVFTDSFQNDDYSQISLQSLGKVRVSNSQFKIESSKKQSLQFLTESFIKISKELNSFINVAIISDNERNDYYQGSKFLYANSTLNDEQDLYFSTNKLQIDALQYKAIEIIDCSFDNLYSSATSNGALIRLKQQSELLLKNNVFKAFAINNCSVGDEGIIYLSSSKLFGNNLLFKNSQSKYTASVLYISSNSYAEISNTQFVNNSAYTYGLTYVTGSSVFICDYCDFNSNHATLDSSILYADNNPKGQVNIKNSVFKNNTSTSNLMTIITTNTFITNSQFEDNNSKLVNNGITSTNSMITLDNVRINYTDQNYINNNDFGVDACFFNINFQSVITMRQTVIQNCRGGTAGVLYATGYSSIIVDDNSQFIDNLSSQQGSGGAFYVLTTQQVKISNSFFINNGIIDINVQRAEAQIYNTTFVKGNQQFIYAQASKLFVYNSTFQNGIGLNIFGKAIYCFCSEMKIENSTFKNLSALKGGALYLTSQFLTSNFSVNNNTFLNNNAQFGGALYIQDATNLSITNNIFQQNNASVISPPTSTSLQYLQKGQGGGIYYGCSNEELNFKGICNVSLTNNTFNLNYAQNDGGALIKVSNQFALNSNNTYISNKALYGSNMASYPKGLKIDFLSNNDYYDSSKRLLQNVQNSTTATQNSTKFNKIVSGTPFTFLAYIIDQEGQIYNTDSESFASLKNKNLNQQVLLNGNEIKSVNGVYNFSSVTAITQPGNNIDLNLNIEGMLSYENDIDFLKNALSIKMQFRNCVSGEQMQNLACQQCPVGTYLYQAPTNNTNCKLCNENAICVGSNLVYPKNQYWRSDNQSEEFIKCPRPDSCLQGNSSNPMGICDIGYVGIVCGICEVNYSKTEDFECEKCPEKTNNIIKIVFLTIFIIFIVIGLVASTFISSGKQTGSTYSVYVKIMASHFQIISAMANINFQWPSYIKVLYTSLVTISSVSTQLFSIDCFLQDTTTSISKDLGVYFMKLLVYGLLPLILAILDLIFWVIYGLIRGRTKTIGNSFTSTLVILLFLVHPTITQQMFQAFNCIQIGDTYYLRSDLNYECYKGTHLKFLIIIVIPSIIIWSFGIPAFALILLIKNKKMILKELTSSTLTEVETQQIKSVKMKYGFIFNGYKIQSFYYEIIIQYRKVFLILVTVILSVVSPEIQALLSFLILILSIIYQTSTKPYLTPILNRMETFSLFVALTTMYSGMYFITGQHYQYYQSQALQWCFFILLIVPNVVFFAYWLYYMTLEILKMAHKKNSTLFCLVTIGLCNYQRFKDKYMSEIAKQPPQINDSIDKVKESNKEKEGYEKVHQFLNQLDTPQHKFQKPKKTKIKGSDFKLRSSDKKLKGFDDLSSAFEDSPKDQSTEQAFDKTVGQPIVKKSTFKKSKEKKEKDLKEVKDVHEDKGEIKKSHKKKKEESPPKKKKVDDDGDVQVKKDKRKSKYIMKNESDSLDITF